MRNNPRIMVFKLKELIYTAVFVVLGILLIILLINMFDSDDSDDTKASNIKITSYTEMVPLATTASPDNVSAENPITEPVSESANVTEADTTSAIETTRPNNETTKSNTQVPESKTVSNTNYVPGIYTSSLMLNNSSLEIQVCVDANHINSVSIDNMDESITTMYPLMENSINDISNQIVNTQSLENISYTDDCKYTYMILIDAINTTLNKARIN